FTARGGFVTALAGVHGGSLFAVTVTTVPCSPKSGVLCGEGTLLRFDGSAWIEAEGPASGMLVAAFGSVWNLDGSGWDQLFRYDGNRWVTVASAQVFEQSVWTQAVA